MSETVVKLDKVVKTYFMGDNQVQALRGISFEIEQGEFTAIMGPSGSGKSTCMNMIGCLDRPSSGLVEINGRETANTLSKTVHLSSYRSFTEIGSERKNSPNAETRPNTRAYTMHFCITLPTSSFDS